MTDIKVPKIGTRVEVTTQYTTEWMNLYSRPSVGIVAHSNPWDKPGTMRLVEVDNCIHESVINLQRVTELKILGTSREPNNPEAAMIAEVPAEIQTFQVKGSKDNVYTVTISGDQATCTCPAGAWGRDCKHVKAIKAQLAM